MLPAHRCDPSYSTSLSFFNVEQGINEILVVVNKMDSTSPPYSQGRFTSIQTEVIALFNDIENAVPQYNSDKVTGNRKPLILRFIPVSGLCGENIIKLSDGCPLAHWYDNSDGDSGGLTLLQALNTLTLPTRQVRKPLRAVVITTETHRPLFTSSSVGKGCEVVVRVLRGCLRVDRHVTITGASPHTPTITSTTGIALCTDMCCTDYLLP